MRRHRYPGFNYTLREPWQRRFPGEPHPVDPRATTKRRIERRCEELALQREIAKWP